MPTRPKNETDIDAIVGLVTPEVIPSMMVSTAKKSTRAQLAAAVVNGWQVIVDRTKVCEMDILLVDTLTITAVTGQLTI
jgi:hypothetical protein